MNKTNNFFNSLIENLLVITIIISLLCLFIEDFIKFLDISHYLKVIQLINFVFNAVFTIEFLIKIYFSIIKKDLRLYFIYNRGWIDFIASIPLLVLISIPELIKNYNPGISFWIVAIPNSLLLLKFCRILKLVKIIKYKKLILFQKQISTISIITTLSMIVFLSGINFLQENRLLFSTYINNQQNSFINLIYFSMILFVISSISLFYGRQFKIYIFHPISEIIKGFEEIYYTKEVKIPKNYNDDEIFLLADNFNKRWLPAKLRKLQEIKGKGLTVVNISKKGKNNEY